MKRFKDTRTYRETSCGFLRRAIPAGVVPSLPLPWKFPRAARIAKLSELRRNYADVDEETGRLFSRRRVARTSSTGNKTNNPWSSRKKGCLANLLIDPGIFIFLCAPYLLSAESSKFVATASWAVGLVVKNVVLRSWGFTDVFVCALRCENRVLNWGGSWNRRRQTLQILRQKGFSKLIKLILILK